MFRYFLFLQLFLLPIQFAYAEIKLILWHPPGYDYSLALPIRTGQTAEDALDEYLQGLNKNPELNEFAKPLNALNGKGTLTPWLPNSTASVFAIANDADDLVATPPRMHKVLDPLDSTKIRKVLVPVAATLELSSAEKKEFQEILNNDADLLISVGGDDIHPKLYRRKSPYSVNTNLSRDQEEVKLVKSYLENGNGFFFGICRGHQMAGVASGCPLISDIEKELKISYPRGGTKREIILAANPGIEAKEIFDNKNQITVFSNHHQAVEVKPDAPVKITATSKDTPIVQMADYFNGRGMGVQFHPENLPESKATGKIYELLTAKAIAAKDQRLLSIKVPPKAIAPAIKAAGRIDREKTLFGVEYTFQDQAMVNEKGRMVMSTPHKEKKLATFREAYLLELGISKKAVVNKPGFKAGSFIDVPGDGRHVMNMEPVTIEVNTTPKHFDEIEAAATPIFNASKVAKLVPYVNPAAERSGMGHIHVGAETLAESPFYKNPNLLRNIMVYYHKHPSLLWGFAEAYDVGNNSNIETFHDPKKQEAFERAIKKYDDWYLKTSKSGGDISDGLKQFLLALKSEEKYGIDFFHHYRAINLEHLTAFRDGSMSANKPGKATVEFRNFRPPNSPQHAKADAELLLDLMEKLSEPGYLEKFETISPAAYERFHTASKVAADWEIVKAGLPSKNPLWDEMVGEYVSAQFNSQIIRTSLKGVKDIEIYPAYSEKEKKGSYFELRVPVKENPKEPKLTFQNQELKFEKVKVDGKNYWVAFLKSEKSQDGPALRKAFSSPASCDKQFGLLL